MMAALMALLAVSAIPVAFAQDQNDRQEDRSENRAERFEDNGFFFFGDDDEDRFDEDNRFFFFGDDDEDRFDGDNFDNNFDNGSGIGQEFEQEAESGDVNQSFDVSNTGDNSNQCAGIQGVANTGNAQNQTGVLQYGSTADDFEFDEVGSSIEVSPENTTTCDQQVNQAATATG
jgi:lipopolysaccharide export LptBFGC system permease protein LptF